MEYASLIIAYCSGDLKIGGYEEHFAESGRVTRRGSRFTGAYTAWNGSGMTFFEFISSSNIAKR
ncbi:MAG TPA: hypothetical protein VFA13_04715 [Candidatus Acidoferrum sp.]|jgi:hypothetical protein|nr:hypothetical protein [Candidatus Acidoferrum sp.]